MTRVLLEDWVHRTNASPYRAPEAIVEWYTGTVYGHPYHEDGTWVITSAKVSGEGDEIATLNTHYKLGKAK